MPIYSKYMKQKVSKNGLLYKFLFIKVKVQSKYIKAFIYLQYCVKLYGKIF